MLLQMLILMKMSLYTSLKVTKKYIGLIAEIYGDLTFAFDVLDQNSSSTQ